MRKVLLSDLLLSTTFPRILFERLQAILFLAVAIDVTVKELSNLLSIIKHVLWG